ncbi:leucine-rich repeat extensin-like protein 3 [Phragmites australis]|uniref:leucine-rich repeat extensin-like protein 3 n=1 Tax=Phragmites australis TaxID=29695 RepID=UPI002D79F6CD|nr:leucine-rich repeat extensin-like protein 3 [Phragmites australis]
MADSGDSSPHSAAATDEAHHEGSEAAAAAAPPPAKVRLMVSYGGRIQPRPHDNQLAYVNGETKILSLERPPRFADFAARLAALAANPAGVRVKYQLPGEDLDALVSVTNDEDLEHLVLEYDRLHLLRPSPGSGGGSSRGSTLRLRVFLFPVQSPPPPAGLLEPKPERHWFVEALNNVPQPKQETMPVHQSPPQQKQEAVFAQQPSPPQAKQETVFVQQPPQPTVVQMPAPPPPMGLAPTGPDYLFGLDNGFVPPPAVKVKDPAGDVAVSVEIPARNDDRHPNPSGDHVAVSPVVSPAEFQRQIQELEKLQVAENATHQPQLAPAPAAALPRNGSDDSLTHAHPPANATPTANTEYYLPKFPEKPPVPPPSSAPSATAYLPMPGRYTSVAPGSGVDHAPLFFIPAPHGYFAATASPGATSFPAVYAVAPPNANANANGSNPSPGVSDATAYAPARQVAYDSNGRAIYYTSVLPHYPSAVNGMSAAGTVLGAEPTKPVAVKPTVS